jgi:hypothetical protein
MGLRNSLWRRSIFGVVSLVLAATVGIAFLTPTPARAAGGGDGCNPNRAAGSEGTQLDDWYNTQSSAIGGAYANIYNYSPYVATGSGTNGVNETVAAWTVVAKDTNNFGQVGWMEWGYGHTPPLRHVFVQIESGGVYQTQYFDAQTQDTSTYYTTLFSPNGSGGTLSFQVAGSTLSLNSTLTAAASVTWQPLWSKISGEVLNGADQMPGDQRSGKAETFEDSSFYQGGSWHAYSGNSGTATENFQSTYWSNSTASETGKGGTLSIKDWSCPSAETVFQDNTGNLHSYDSTSGGVGYLLPMASGTSPTITGTQNSGWTAAYQDNNNHLHTYTSGGTSTNTNQGMLSGTSPSIATLSNGSWMIAFQANNNVLYTYSSAGTSTSTGQGMLSGTNPSITATSGGGWVIAFQANNGNLYTYTSGGTSTNRSQGMESGTSPAITTLTNGHGVIAFQANNATLYTYSSGGTSTNTNQGMLSTTTPSIAWT